MPSSEVTGKIEEMISSSKIFLFMKGEKEQPMCGFSAQVITLLNKNNAEYNTFNVLSDWDIREGLKEFSSWPTIPQLYVEGKFVGGCDIVMELDRSDELKKTLGI